ncbi:ABC transporter ATP-binding protein [Paenibacillus paeoniae]|uniref:ABC transporter ATP-binding protein n=1 Tax=Paenibacillus paeoniae TaxID=2292705 RepID=A0A371PJT0_9BACL|nr:ABC transporter ATP-binding protein [Paenibacillus paeoniae]REK76047.1 ABC transporter ATP-binding protein [Paenibacillus paeoniae]
MPLLTDWVKKAIEPEPSSQQRNCRLPEAGERDEDELLAVRNLSVNVKSSSRPVIEGIDLTVGRGEIVGIVGESGCGKSVLSLSIMGLLPSALKLGGGELRLNGQSLHQASQRQIRSMRGKHMSMIFQDPMTSLNPTLTIGEQLTESLRLHLKLGGREARERAVLWLRRTGLPRPEAILSSYPHQLSGGMRQRVMIAIALCCEPELLIADEPTTALDVTIQAQILDVLFRIREEEQTSILFISHDLGVIAELCDRVAVMYAGQIVEQGTVEELFESPQHPYTIGLMKSIPKPEKKGMRLYAIPGTVPSLHDRGEGCRFQSRCAHAAAICLDAMPALEHRGGSHAVRCFLASGERREMDV